MQTVKVFKNYHYGVLVDWQQGHQGHDSFQNIAKYYAKVSLMYPGSFIRTTTLRHSEVFQNYFIVLAIFYIIFVFTDITFTTVMLIQGMNSIGTTYNQMIVFFTVYPLAGLLSPVFGILSVGPILLTQSGDLVQALLLQRHGLHERSVPHRQPEPLHFDRHHRDIYFCQRRKVQSNVCVDPLRNQDLSGSTGERANSELPQP
jgi:hypothetical protein